MSSKIVFCIGGNRSGKSAFAMQLAAKVPGPKLFIATAEARDPEMSRRVKKHQAERGQEWQCFEVPFSQSCRVAELLPLAMLPPPFDLQVGGKVQAVLVDCLSTWVSACQESWNGAPTETESGIIDSFDDFLTALAGLDMPVFIVSAEVGMGVIAPSAEIRQFCDVLGTVNQRVAQVADEVYFCVSGLNLKIK